MAAINNDRFQCQQRVGSTAGLTMKPSGCWPHDTSISKAKTLHAAESFEKLQLNPMEAVLGIRSCICGIR
jgi:hypothetical protein